MSIVTDELEATVLAALPGETPTENADYLRQLAYRLTLTADDLDPEPEPTINPSPLTPPTVLVTGNPLDGISLHGPFSSSEDAFSHADRTRLTEWWTAPLHRPDS